MEGSARTDAPNVTKLPSSPQSTNRSIVPVRGIASPESRDGKRETRNENPVP